MLSRRYRRRCLSNVLAVWLFVQLVCLSSPPHTYDSKYKSDGRLGRPRERERERERNRERERARERSTQAGRQTHGRRNPPTPHGIYEGRLILCKRGTGHRSLEALLCHVPLHRFADLCVASQIIEPLCGASFLCVCMCALCVSVFCVCMCVCVLNVCVCVCVLGEARGGRRVCIERNWAKGWEAEWGSNFV